MTTVIDLADPAEQLEEAPVRPANSLLALPTWVVLVQAFLGLGWLRAGAEKALSVDWWLGAELEAFAREASPVEWYEPMLDLTSRLSMPVAVGVVCAELAIGVALLTGRRVGVALATATALNLSFIASGEVTPSVFYLLAQGALALWMVERAGIAGRIDAWLSRSGVVGAGLFLVNLPFVGGLAPGDVIHDPAAMLAFAGVLVCLVSGHAQLRQCAL